LSLLAFLTLSILSIPNQAQAIGFSSFRSLFSDILPEKNIAINTDWLDSSTLPIFSEAFIGGLNVQPRTTQLKSRPQIMWVPATGYSSTVDQTDDTPFIGAAGTHVRDGVIAANFLPFGTTVKIPDLYGNKLFVVEDRMNKRYSHRIDVWFPTRNEALKFGLRNIKIEIYP